MKKKIIENIKTIIYALIIAIIESPIVEYYFLRGVDIFGMYAIISVSDQRRLLVRV